MVCAGEGFFFHVAQLDREGYGGSIVPDGGVAEIPKAFLKQGMLDDFGVAEDEGVLLLKGGVHLHLTGQVFEGGKLATFLAFSIQSVPHYPGDFLKDILLGREVVGNIPAPHLHIAGDILQGCSGIAFLVEQFYCCLNDLLLGIQNFLINCDSGDKKSIKLLRPDSKKLLVESHSGYRR